VLLPILRIQALDVALNLVEGLSDTSSITDVQDNTTDIRLVSDGLTVQLNNDRITNLGCSSTSILSSLSRDCLRDGNTAKGKDLLALSLTENSTASCTNLVHDLINLSDGGANLASAVNDGLDGLVQLIEMVTVLIEG